MRAIGYFGCLLVLFLLVGCGTPPPSAPLSATPAQATGLQTAPTAAEATPTARTISVTGNAQVLVVPDEVTITLGIETSDLLVATAKSRNEEIVAKVLSAARGLGIEDKHVQTDYMSIDPRYQDSYTQRSFVGFWVRKNVVIILKDMAKFESLLSRTLEAGANYVQGIEFRTTELRKHRDRARTLAIQAAQEKAAAMAKDAGQEVGAPITIREEYNRWYSPWSSWWASSYGRGMAQNVTQNTAPSTAGPSDTALAPGQISVEASVTVTYELKGGAR